MHSQKNKRKRILSSYRWLIFSILAIGYAVAYSHRVAPAVVAPELSESFAIKGGALGAILFGLSPTFFSAILGRTMVGSGQLPHWRF